jgi:AraC-like DNA-binding protein
MQWIHRHIIQQAKLQLKYSDLPVWQIAESLNFPNHSFFSKFFKRETGMTPNEFRLG